MIQGLARQERGQAAAEYALIAAALVLTVAFAAGSLMQIQSAAYHSQHKALAEWRSP